MIVRTKAPLRISFAGGGTDVPPFPQQEGGCVLSATINRYAYGTLRTRKDNAINIESLDYGLSVNYNPEDLMVYDGKLDLVKAAIVKMDGRGHTGFDVFIHSDAPPGSGLGSSSAMMVALVGLLKEFKGLPLTDYDVAELAYVIEREDLAIKGGLQDQYAAAFGGFNYIEFLPDRVIVNPLKIRPDVVNELEYNLLLCYTGSSRLSSNIIEDQVKRYESGEQDSLDAMRQLKALTIEMKNALLRRKLDEFGDLLHHEWENKKKMSHKISTPHLDEMYEAVKSRAQAAAAICCCIAALTKNIRWRNG
jgi:D-glycero-alpha-D-manno-heptose-7-phosphate kinase